MEQLSFKCKINSCKTVFKYTDSLNHIKVCQIPVVKCLANCKEAKTFKGRKVLKEHLVKDCEKLVQVCLDCGENTIREEEAEHDCLPGLIKKIKILEEANNSLKKKQDDFEKRLVSLEPIKE